MSGKLEGEIRKMNPFDCVEQEAHLNVIRTADALMRGSEEIFRQYDLTATQYNALRILRGAGDEGLTCREVGDRMITRDPDITRLLDRLEKRDLIERSRETKDRRVIRVRITMDGLNILEKLDRPILEFHRRQLGHMDERKLRTLIDLLEEARSRPEDE